MSLQLGNYQRYVRLTPNERYAEYLQLEKHLVAFCAKININAADIVCRRDVFFDIIERVAMRRVYFHIFHNKIMSERNAMSHICFWILKLTPIFNAKNQSQPISALFSVYLLMNMLKRVSAGKNKQLVLNHDFAKNIAYAFIYRDISKEAIMAISDALLVGL